MIFLQEGHSESNCAGDLDEETADFVMGSPPNLMAPPSVADI